MKFFGKTQSEAQTFCTKCGGCFRRSALEEVTLISIAVCARLIEGYGGRQVLLYCRSCVPRHSLILRLSTPFGTTRDHYFRIRRNEIDATAWLQGVDANSNDHLVLSQEEYNRLVAKKTTLLLLGHAIFAGRILFVGITTTV